MAACASVAALAGTVAAVATAAGADGDQAREIQRVRALADEGGAARTSVPTAPPVTTAPPRDRAGDASLGATVALLPGWRTAASQDLVPVAPGRFPTVVSLGDRATVLVGRLDPARGFGPDTLADEARRLVGTYVDGVRGDDGDVETVSDEAGSLDDRDEFTSVRRTTTPDGPGSIVRVTTVAPGRGDPGLVVLAVAAPGDSRDDDARTADEVVRSLSSAPGDAPPRTPTSSPPPAAVSTGAVRAPVSRPTSSSEAPTRPLPTQG